MKIRKQIGSAFRRRLFVAGISLMGTVTGMMASNELETRFLDPPAEAKPWVYWFWMNGNLTREGITADLEAMKRTDIGGVLIMHVGAGIPAGPVKFFSGEWRDLFRFAVSEAERLGLEVAMNACDGWTGTGGPWIEPEEAMMKLVWSETRVEGPSAGPIALPQPETNLDVYHDIAAVAFPTPPAEREYTGAVTGLSASDPACDTGFLVDGKMDTATTLTTAGGGDSWIQIEFAQPFVVRGLSLSAPADDNLPGTASLHVSNDGKNFRRIHEATLGWKANYRSVTISFDETPAKFFRVAFSAKRVDLAEVTLLGAGRVHYWEAKAGFARRWGHGVDAPMFRERKSGGGGESETGGPDWSGSSTHGAVERGAVRNLTGRMKADGTLDWEAPPGHWTVLRIGFTPTGEKNGPASVEGTGLEPDALNGTGMEIAFERFFGHLLTDIGPLAGETLRYLHIDSWETGEQNWTAAFPEEFRKRRGYDMIPLLPVMAGGRIVDGVDVSERFLWDVRRTLADLLAENYYGKMRQIANRHGLRFETEAAGAQQFLFDPVTFQQQADLPMGEFWVTEGRIRPDCKAAASVAHIFGRKYVGAEAFTSGPQKARWTQHPYSLKPLGDEAFCHGVNRFIFHRYAMQPWKEEVLPGMTMGPWGIHLERTNTWWEPGRAWFAYLARCQHLLQEGSFVGDVLVFAGDDVPNYLGYRHELNPPLPPGYDYDACNSAILHEASVRDGEIVLPGGMRYRVLLLPDSRRMRPEVLRQVRSLVEAGALVAGPKPAQSPSLAGHPDCDAEVRSLADTLWGRDNQGATDRSAGKGRVFWNYSFEEIFERIGLPPDFDSSGSAELRYIHRRDQGADWYFVSNPADYPVETLCRFRVAGKRPELWHPETGGIVHPAVYRQANGRTELPIRFERGESVFVVFRRESHGDPIAEIKRDGRIIQSVVEDSKQPVRTSLPRSSSQEVSGSFSVTFWAKPEAPIPLPARGDQGITRLAGQRFALLTEQGELVHGPGHASAGISVGTNGVCVFEHSARYLPARLVVETPIDGWTHIALVYEENLPRLCIDGREAASARVSTHEVHPGGSRGHGGDSAVAVRHLQVLDRILSREEIAELARRDVLDLPGDEPIIKVTLDETETPVTEVWKPGAYELRTGSGKTARFDIDSVPPPHTIDGPWEVRFPPGRGAPETVTIESLRSWTTHEQAGVRYFSGTATYEKGFEAPAALFGNERNLSLDLGEVRVIAEARLNGKELGVLWKPPYRVNVNGALKPGRNTLEIQVTNLWPNRLIGDEQVPPDADYQANGALTGWPDWLRPGQPRPEPRRLTFSSWKHFAKDSPLLESGLLGPVTIQVSITKNTRPNSEP